MDKPMENSIKMARNIFLSELGRNGRTMKLVDALNNVWTMESWSPVTLIRLIARRSKLVGAGKDKARAAILERGEKKEG